MIPCFKHILKILLLSDAYSDFLVFAFVALASGSTLGLSSHVSASRARGQVKRALIPPFRQLLTATALCAANWSGRC